MTYECDNCGRDLDEWDADDGLCACGWIIPEELVQKIRAAAIRKDD